MDCSTSRSCPQYMQAGLSGLITGTSMAAHFLGITLTPKCPAAGVFEDTFRQSSLLTEIIIKPLTQERAK